MKRYAIVRVDNTWCPNKFENGVDSVYICTNENSIKSDENCKNCRYGDTKEQLIAKVEQILWQEMKKEFVSKHTISSKPIARKIVEFLGVEE